MSRKEERAALAELERGGWTCEAGSAYWLCTHPDAVAPVKVGGLIGWNRQAMRRSCAKALGQAYRPDTERRAARAEARDRRRTAEHDARVEARDRLLTAKDARDRRSTLDPTAWSETAPRIRGLRLTLHAAQRMHQRGRTLADVLAALDVEPHYQSNAAHHVTARVEVVVADGQIITVT